jgi:hypothetical protein
MKFSDKSYPTARAADIAHKLETSAQFSTCLRVLEGKKRRNRFPWATSLEDWLHWSVQRSLAEFEPFEKMTAKQRIDTSKRITSHCEALRDLLSPFHDDVTGLGWPFQPELDFAALTSALNYKERHSEDYEGLDEYEAEDMFIQRRFAMYHLAMVDLGLVLDALQNGAERLGELQSHIKKPNDPNAARLSFMRRQTKELLNEFGQPYRTVVLALTSVFFEADDLDEAAVSKLAPVETSPRIGG